jgi:hypothetical protein
VPTAPIGLVSAAGDRATWRVAALFLALTLVATYPIVRAPATYAYFGHSDAQLNMWIMAWDAHALRHDPRNLFNANVFYPERQTLVYSETLLGYLPLFGPILWMGGSPALAFNVVLLFSFFASGLAMYLLARHLTGRHLPAIVAGLVYAFTPYRFVHIPQIQLEAIEWIPLAFLCLHLFVERGHRRYALGLAACIVVETLCCVYYGVFLAIALVAATGILAVVDRRARQWRTLVTLAAAAGLATIAVAPVAGEYLRLHRLRHLERPIEEITEKSAEPASYLASTTPLHQRLWSASLPAPRDYLFPGIAALMLTTIAIAGAIGSLRRTQVVAASRHIVLLYAVIAAIGLIASLGPHGLAGLSLYALLYSAIPIFHGLRQVSRFGVLALFGISVLASVGAAIVEWQWPRGAGAQALCAAVVFLELCPAPLRQDRPGGVALTHVPPTPPEYAWLAARPGSFGIVEFPYAYEGQLWENASYVYWSTSHWHGLVDAYSGFAPPGYASLARILTNFPDRLSQEALETRDVRYVIIHRDRYRPWNRPLNFDRLNRTPWLRQVAQFAGVDILEVQPDDRTMPHARRR